MPMMFACLLIINNMYLIGTKRDASLKIVAK